MVVCKYKLASFHLFFCGWGFWGFPLRSGDFRFALGMAAVALGISAVALGITALLWGWPLLLWGFILLIITQSEPVAHGCPHRPHHPHHPHRPHQLVA